MFKQLHFKSWMLALILIIGGGNLTVSAEETSTLTFTAKCNGSGTADDGVAWTVTSDGNESTYDSTKGIHYGTSSAAVQYIKLTTSDIAGTITKVVVNASTASGVSATASVTVGGTPFGGDAQSLTTTATNYTFEGSASGEIVVTVTKPSSATKALYVKSVAVTYEEGTAKTLTSITLSGTYPTSFVEGSTFSHEGVVVTANYDDNSTENVTSDATFSTPDMSQVGQQTVTVTYQKKTATYNINITALPTHTATFSVNGSTSTAVVKEGAIISFPTVTNPEGKEFMGWVTEAIDGVTQTAPTMVTSATMGTKDVTYYAVFATKTPGTAETKTDVLNQTFTGVTDTSYTDWSGEGTSGAVYAGQSAGGNSSIQLRSNNNNSGIITTTSGGKAKKVTVDWNSNTAKGRTLDVYGKSSAYEAASELYNAANQGTKLGSIVMGTSTELTIDGDYAYIGLRSNNGAMYLTSVSIVWGTPDTYSDYCTTVPAPETVTVTSAGWATFAPTKDVQFDNEVMSAYIVTGATTTSATLTAVSAVPADTPVLVCAQRGTYTLAGASTTPAAVTGNKLLVSDGKVTGNGQNIYALGVQQNGEVGFMLVDDGVEIPDGKCYLQIPAGARSFLSLGGGEETAIKSVATDVNEDTVYDLQGRRVNGVKQGLYIVNGKKVVLK